MNIIVLNQCLKIRDCVWPHSLLQQSGSPHEFRRPSYRVQKVLGNNLGFPQGQFVPHRSCTFVQQHDSMI